ncbi:NAD(P)/FAD-dependent oxidoreductase [Nocardia asiatica]|uniref:NAD(P)/FAD-dependent oxidoreductase n=1 Tax=Nocardia asiatica TaxID=209252 RepID=UPI0024587DFD|nr:FAD-dependent oxidoreductase [Nocardia asiatica]
MTSPRSIVVVGESIAGITAARELRTLGHTGRLTIIGADQLGGYSRPPLSKAVLHDPAAEGSLPYRLDDLEVDLLRESAVSTDCDARTVTTATGRTLAYDALIAATGADARRLAVCGQTGELVLRTLEDARTLRARLSTATSAIVVGAGFLGMEVASACVARGVAVTVIDVDPPLRRILGPFLSDVIRARAEEHGVRIVQTPRLVTLADDPICGVILGDGSVSTADLVVTCAGEVPNTSWLDGSGVADERGIGIDHLCATTTAGVYAAGDVAYSIRDGRRAPFWSNAVAQGKVAAASVLGLASSTSATDDYFWTEILGVSIKIVGPLPLVGEPTSVEGSIADGAALLTWKRADMRPTVVAYGIRKSVAALRKMTGSI